MYQKCLTTTAPTPVIWLAHCGSNTYTTFAVGVMHSFIYEYHQACISLSSLWPCTCIISFAALNWYLQHSRVFRTFDNVVRLCHQVSPKWVVESICTAILYPYKLKIHPLSLLHQWFLPSQNSISCTHRVKLSHASLPSCVWTASQARGSSQAVCLVSTRPCASAHMYFAAIHKNGTHLIIGTETG